MRYVFLHILQFSLVKSGCIQILFGRDIVFVSVCLCDTGHFPRNLLAYLEGFFCLSVVYILGVFNAEPYIFFFVQVNTSDWFVFRVGKCACKSNASWKESLASLKLKTSPSFPISHNFCSLSVFSVFRLGKQLTAVPF